MNHPHPRKALVRLQQQMQKVWARYELCCETRDKAGQYTNLAKFKELESFEAELLAEIKSLSGTMEKPCSVVCCTQ